jgi:hypothetical protein
MGVGASLVFFNVWNLFERVERIELFLAVR